MEQFPDTPERSCINCGFYGHIDQNVENGLVTSKFEVAALDNRREPWKPPRCYRLALDLESLVEIEVPKIEAAFERLGHFKADYSEGEWRSKVRTDAHSSVIRTDQDCAEFHPWTPWWTAEQHLTEAREMKKEQWRVEAEMRATRERRIWEQQESAFARDHETMLSAMADIIQSDMASATRTAAHYQLAGVIVGVLGILAAVVIALWLSHDGSTVNNFYDNSTFTPTQSVPDTATPQPSPTE
ncbi:MAG: hypothetical protein AB7N24_18725 [Dehalococcoidia bacterium]